jgi:hypothetical protein
MSGSKLGDGCRGDRWRRKICAKPFWEAGVYAISAKRCISELSRDLHFFSDNEAPVSPVASLFFYLTADALRMQPTPGNPAKIAALDGPDGDVGEEEMLVFHRAYVK